jgi:hypothetical protein
MRGIAKLLFGDETGRLPGLFGDGDAGGFGPAEQARRSGEWCASTPGRGSAAGAARGLARPRGAAPRDPRESRP